VRADGEALPMRDGYVSATRMPCAGSYLPVHPLNSACREPGIKLPTTPRWPLSVLPPRARKGSSLTRNSQSGEVVVVHNWPRPGSREDPGRAQAAGRRTQLCSGPCRAPDSDAAGGCRCGGDCVLLDVELKTGGLCDDGFPAAVVRGIDENSLYERALLSSFHPVALRRSGQLNPGIPTGMSYPCRRPLFLR
jgi:hypothetical protein